MKLRYLLPFLSAFLIIGCGQNADEANTKATAEPTAAQTEKATPIKVGIVRVMDDAQAMLAKEGGFFEKYGLDAELIEFSSGTDLIKAIVGGQLDYGVLGFSNAFTWASKGADLRIIGGAQRGYHSILVRTDSGINSVADLKGKSLASQKQGSTADIVLKGVVLDEAGLSEKDVQIMGVKPAIAVQSLVAGNVEAAFLFEPYDRIARLTAPVKEIYEIGEHWPFPCMVVITSADTLAAKKDILWDAMDAQREAIDLLTQDPAKAATFISDYFIAEPTLQTLDQGEVDRNDVIEAAIRTQTFSALLSEQDIKRMYELKDIMEAQGVLQPGSLDVERVINLDWQKARGITEG